MVPLSEHGYFKQSISIAIEDIAEALNRDYESYGSATCLRQAEQAGLEADNCFYFQNEAQIRGKLTFDLDQDPPPDLALEIDITCKSLARLAEEVTEHYLEIREVATGMVVTVIELLSPNNKRPGEERIADLRKRNQMLAKCIPSGGD